MSVEHQKKVANEELERLRKQNANKSLFEI